MADNKLTDKWGGGAEQLSCQEEENASYEDKFRQPVTK